MSQPPPTGPSRPTPDKPSPTSATNAAPISKSRLKKAFFLIAGVFMTIECVRQIVQADSLTGHVVFYGVFAVVGIAVTVRIVHMHLTGIDKPI